VSFVTSSEKLIHTVNQQGPYSQRNWVEVFYREAKGWLGLKEYQVRSLKSLHRHLILVFCAYSFIIWQQLTGGLRRRPSKQTFKDFY
jgi:hypothetical protein